MDERSDELTDRQTDSMTLRLNNGSIFRRMYKQGHTVCGVELIERVVKEFFDENSIPVEVADVESVGKVYKVRSKLQYRVESIINSNPVNSVLCFASSM